MKNFGSILAFLAISATVVSARALPAENGLEARAPYPIEVAAIYAREPKKGKAAANGTASADKATTSATGKKNKGAKAAKGGAASNSTASAVSVTSNSTSTATGKKGKGAKAAKGGAASNSTTITSSTDTKGANKNAQAASSSSDVDALVQSLTGLDLGSLGLRSIPKLESRKKKNKTSTATGAAAAGSGKAAAKAAKAGKGAKGAAKAAKGA